MSVKHIYLEKHATFNICDIHMQRQSQEHLKRNGHLQISYVMIDFDKQPLWHKKVVVDFAW